MELFTLVIFTLLFSVAKCEIGPCQNSTKPSELCHLNENYDPSGYPPCPGPCLIDITMEVKDVLEIDEKANTISLFLNIIAEWNDKRIYINRTQEQIEKSKEFYNLKMPEVLTMIWYPTFYFVNVINLGKLGAFGGPDTKSLWYKHPQKFWYSEIIIVKVACQEMSFSTFPFDKHYCQLLIRNWIGSNEDVKLNKPSLFKLNGTSKETHLDFTHPKLQFDLKFEANETTILNQFSHPYSLARIGITMERNLTGLLRIIGSYMIPLGIFAALSMISFFVNSDSVKSTITIILKISLVASVFDFFEFSRAFSVFGPIQLGNQSKCCCLFGPVQERKIGFVML